MIEESGLVGLGPWIGDFLERLSPARRIVVARKIGQALRRTNARRIAANVDPDGSKQTPRKKKGKLHTRAGKIRRTGKMFQKLKILRRIQVRATADDVSVGFSSRVSRVAAIHQYGEIGSVGKRRDGSVIRTRYPARRLLGFGPGDEEIVMDALLAALDRKT